MDVHDLARAMIADWTEAETPRWQWWSIGNAYNRAALLLPFIEAHTRAAVEAERAACEAVARDVSKQCEAIGALRSSDTADNIADAIERGEHWRGE